MYGVETAKARAHVNQLNILATPPTYEAQLPILLGYVGLSLAIPESVETVLCHKGPDRTLRFLFRKNPNDFAFTDERTIPVEATVRVLQFATSLGKEIVASGASWKTKTPSSPTPPPTQAPHSILQATGRCGVGDSVCVSRFDYFVEQEHNVIS